jgi:hypothetical protein
MTSAAAEVVTLGANNRLSSGRRSESSGGRQRSGRSVVPDEQEIPYPHHPEGNVMYDLAAIGVAAVCFCFTFALLYVLERV